MNYNIEDAKKATKYLESGMAPATVALILNKTSERKYAASDINAMVTELKDNQPPSGNGRLYDMAAGIVFNKSKRRRMGLIALSIFVLFSIGMIMLGIFVSWIPVLITIGALIGLILIVIVASVIMIRTGFLERYIDKFDN